MPPYYSAIPVNEYRYGYALHPEPISETIFLPDRKGDLVSLRELSDIIVPAFDKSPDEYNAFAFVGLISILKFRSLLLALPSPITAEVHHQG